jgi:hypothetical protein
VKNDAKRAVFARVQLADTVPHLHAIGATRALHRSFAHRENDQVALL